MEVDYYSKYLKYKSKYLELKAQIGLGKDCAGKSCCTKKGCLCPWYKGTGQKGAKCSYCDHLRTDHRGN